MRAFVAIVTAWTGCSAAERRPATTTTTSGETIMSKKHFIRMAAEFKTILESLDVPEAKAGVILAIEAFMRMAKDCNGRFDRDRFRSACGL